MDCDSERIWKIVENQRHNVPKKKRPPGSSLSLFDRLYDCYVECTLIQNDKNFDKRFRNTVNLLQQLSPDHTHPSLVINLYSDDRGYSLVLNPDEQEDEIFFQYEDNEIFSYLDNQEIPPVLMEVLSQTSHCHMDGGCVVCEVRNYRSPSSVSSRLPYDTHLLMLRPTTESILQMVNEIASETCCSQEDQLLLESKLLLATQPPICLDPSTEVVWVTNRLHYNRRKFHSPGMRRYLRRRSQARRARMEHTSLQPAPSELRLHDFLTATTSGPLRCSRPQFSDMWKRKQHPRLSLSTTSATAVGKRVQELASVVPEPPSTLSMAVSPTLDPNPASVNTPPPHLRAQGQKFVEEFLESRERSVPRSLPLPSSQMVNETSVETSVVSHHPSPAHKTTPTIQTSQSSHNSLHTPSQPHTAHSFTISLPLAYTSQSKPLPHTLPTPQSAQLPIVTSSHHTLPPRTTPTSLRVISAGKRQQPIASAPPTPPHPRVAMTAGKMATSQHPTAAVRSLSGVITASNRKPVTTTKVVGTKPVKLLTPPKLQRPPNLALLSTATKNITMPKLHRLATLTLPTPSLSLQPCTPSYPPLQAPPPPSSLPSNTTSAKAMPPMPVLHRLAIGNGTASSATPTSGAKATLPVLKPAPVMAKLKKIQLTPPTGKP